MLQAVMTIEATYDQLWTRVPGFLGGPDLVLGTLYTAKHRIVVPEPYQAGFGSNPHQQHEPGGCCNANTCGWMHDAFPGHNLFGQNYKQRYTR